MSHNEWPLSPGQAAQEARECVQAVLLDLLSEEAEGAGYNPLELSFGYSYRTRTMVVTAFRQSILIMEVEWDHTTGFMFPVKHLI